MKKFLLISIVFISCHAAQQNTAAPGGANPAQVAQNVEDQEKAAKERIERNYAETMLGSHNIYINRQGGYSKESLLLEHFQRGNKALATYCLDRLELMQKEKDRKQN